MNCDVVQDKLTEYIDKKLDAATFTIVEDHLSSCATCRADVEDLSYSVELAAAEPEL
jgi:anti-sigma factor RsiW